VKAGPLAIALLLTMPAAARAEWQLRPFLGATFGGGTTLVDLDEAVGSGNVGLGMSGVLIGEVVGLEADLGYGPGFFQNGDRHRVVSSSVATLTGNVIVAVPRRVTQYTLRPYFVGGGGMMRARSEDVGNALAYTVTLRAMDLGGGMTGFLTNRFGLSWDVRYFRSVGGKDVVGFSFGPEELSFWRAVMALAIRLERKPQ
jgi:hypothetical protein